MKGLTHEQAKELKRRIVEYRKAGHYASECAKYFGVSVSYVHGACNGIDYPWKYDTETMSKAAKAHHKLTRKPAEDKCIEILSDKASWCEYVGGYVNYESHIDVRCKGCGRQMRISFGTLRTGTSSCPECKKKQIEEDKAAREKARAEAKEEEKRAKQRERAVNRKFKQMRFAICPTCGDVFYSSTKYCSVDCSNKANNAIKKDRRIRKIKAGEYDKGITLEKLYGRDGGTCSICKGRCDWNDYIITDNGFHIAGGRYPSIDHIIPLSKGGKHKWDNVQLAHRACNTLKSDSLTLPCQKTG